MNIIEHVERLAAEAGVTFEDWQMQSVVRMYIQQLVGPDTYLPGAPVGPYEFPRSPIEVRGPVTQHRYDVWRNAAYPGFEFDEDASLAALDVSEEVKARIAVECDFIKKYTPTAPVWKLPDDPLAHPAIPRPSTTPPMWAHDPTRSRRPRRNRNQPNRQGIN